MLLASAVPFVDPSALECAAELFVIVFKNHNHDDIYDQERGRRYL
jgi:hypothetical protein